MPHKFRVEFIFLVVVKVRQCLLCFALSACMIPSALAVEVVMNAGNSDELLQESYDLRSIFSMRTRYWVNGEKIRVFVLPDDNVLHKAFVKEKLQMFPHQLRRTWNRMTYTGTGQPPVTVDSIEEMLEKIKSTAYSIGYIDRRVDDESIYYFNVQ